MLGMELMLKSMGFDPETIKEEFQRTIIMAGEKMEQIQSQLNRIEANQILLYQLMVKAGVIEEPPKLIASENEYADRKN